METPRLTARSAAKHVVQAIVAHRAGKLTKTTITEHTRFEKDDFVVDITSGLVAWYVSDKLSPVTNAIVDRTADKIAEFRAKRRSAKKDKPE